MSSKETPKKVYRTGKSNIAVSSCRLCSAVGDAIHCKNIFKPLNRHLLKIAEQLCGHPIVFEKSLPHLVCRPCERRLKNTIEFQKVLRESEQKFQRQLSQTRSKRCIDISPSVSQPPIKSRLATSTEDETGRARTTARAALSFQSCVETDNPLLELPDKQMDMILKDADKELINVARKDEPSVLRDGTYHGLSEQTWMTEVVKELSTRCPTVAQILSKLLDCCIGDPENKLPHLCLIYSIIMFVRCKHLSRVQRINTVLLTEGNATTNLINRLNKYGFCLSSSKKYAVLDEIGNHFLEHAIELVKTGMKFVYVVDNIDWEEKVHDMQEHHQNKSVHAVATSMVFSRVSSDHLPNDGPQKDIKKCNIREIVNMSNDEINMIRYRYKILVARVLLKKFAKFSSLKSCMLEELSLTHEHSDATAIKSEIITMPVLMKDEKKYSDCVDVLAQLEDWAHDIYKASGHWRDPDQPTLSDPLVVVPTRPDQPRSHIPPAASESDPMHGVKIPVFGDELTRVRFAGARDLRSGCHTAKQRLDHLYPYRIVGWHTKRSFLKSVFKRLYKNSGRESGTLRYFREVLNRRNVNIDIKHYEACKQLFISIGQSYLVEALLEFFKMDDMDQSPNENNSLLFKDDLTEGERKEEFVAVLNKFVDEFLSPASREESMAEESFDEDAQDFVLNYSVNLLKSYMVILDCKDAVASGNGKHLALIQKQLLFHFSAVPGYNLYAIEMLIAILQNEVLLSPAEAHQCQWAGMANWKGGRDKNIEIDLLQENQNSNLKGLIKLMGANKTEKSTEKVSKAAAGVRKVVDVYEDQTKTKQKSSAHSHKSSAQDEQKILSDLRKLKPFSPSPGRSHQSFVGISANPLEELNEEKFNEWLQRHQRNIALHFPSDNVEEDDEEESDVISNLLDSLQVDDIDIQY